MRRISVRILCTLMALLLCACAAPAAQPVPSPTAVPTPEPAATPIPEPTPAPFVPLHELLASDDIPGNWSFRGGDTESVVQLYGLSQAELDIWLTGLKSKGVTVEQSRFIRFPSPKEGKTVFVLEGVSEYDGKRILAKVNGLIEHDTEQSTSFLAMGVQEAGPMEYVLEDVTRELYDGTIAFFYLFLGVQAYNEDPPPAEGTGDCSFWVGGLEESLYISLGEMAEELMEGKLTEMRYVGTEILGRYTFSLSELTEEEIAEAARLAEEVVQDYGGTLADCYVDEKRGMAFAYLTLPTQPEADAYVLYTADVLSCFVREEDGYNTYRNEEGSSVLEIAGITDKQCDRYLDLFARLGVEILDTVYYDADVDGEAVPTAILTVAEDPAITGIYPLLFSFHDVESISDLPDGWPPELPFPAGASILSAGYDDAGRYVVDLDDGAWDLEQAQDYVYYAAENAGFSGDMNDDSMIDERGLHTCKANMAYALLGLPCLLEVHCDTLGECTAEIILSSLE